MNFKKLYINYDKSSAESVTRKICYAEQGRQQSQLVGKFQNFPEAAPPRWTDGVATNGAPTEAVCYRGDSRGLSLRSLSDSSGTEYAQQICRLKRLDAETVE